MLFHLAFLVIISKSVVPGTIPHELIAISNTKENVHELTKRLDNFRINITAQVALLEESFWENRKHDEPADKHMNQTLCLQREIPRARMEVKKLLNMLVEVYSFANLTNMLKYAILLAAFTASVSCSSERNFGILTIRYIMDYYNDQLGSLEVQFENNIHKYFTNLESRALTVNEALASCVHEGYVPVEERLVEEAKKTLEEEINKIKDILASVEDLDTEEINELWSSVSEDGTFRDEMNALIMKLKSETFQKLEEFKMEITAKCSHLAVKA
ncbi:hypothetical protein GE061_019627 [Apolygus lucorum]|uniref:Uncharacterized protein n=1 Tax=Apolygus lucorum TaxID=248454 RepID=A0A8S9XAA6_APOLU|nr:hypothetical protein GE061_019627 [Apolygus lucorum]